MNHTPGQWYLVETDNTIRSRAWGESDQMADYQGVIICDLTPGIGGREHAKPEALANAALIAAAPDTLKQLQALLLAFRITVSTQPQCCQDAAQELIAQAEAVIAKATNTQQGKE